MESEQEEVNLVCATPAAMQKGSAVQQFPGMESEQEEVNLVCATTAVESEQEEAPWVMDPIAQSGFLVKTEVKDSSIVDAGLARFVKEDVQKGQVIRATKLVDAKQGRPAPGTTVVSNSKQTLIDVMRYDDVKGRPTNDEQIVNFAATPFNVEEANDVTFHWVPCNYFNHCGSPNVVLALPLKADGMVHVVALRDIAAGEELFQDYRSFRLPPWFMSICDEWNLTSTQILGMQLDGMDKFTSQYELSLSAVQIN